MPLANSISLSNTALIGGASGGIPGGYVRIYSGGTVTPSGWTPSGGAVYYFGNEVWADPSITQLIVPSVGVDGDFDFTLCPNLAAFYCQQNAIASLDVTGLVLLNTLDCHLNALAVITGLEDCVALVTLDCDQNALTLGNLPASASLTSLDAHSNGMAEADVDAVLAALVANGAINGTVNLGPNNAAPSAAGLADKATLEGDGWTVTVTP